MDLSTFPYGLPSHVVRTLRWRFETFLDNIYFEVVHTKPWVDYRYSRGWCVPSLGATAEGVYHVGDNGSGVALATLKLSWRIDPASKETSTFCLAADFIGADAPEDRLWHFTFEQRGPYEGRLREILQQLNTLESMAGRVVSAIDRRLPVLPSIFERGTVDRPPEYRDYAQLLRWAEGLPPEESPKAKSLLSIIASIPSDTSDPSALQFGRQACILLTQFPFAYSKNGAWNPLWYQPLFVRALGWASHSIKQNPRDLAAHMDRGMIRGVLRNHRGAAEDYSVALGLDDTLVCAYLGRAWASSCQGFMEEAIRDYTRALDIAPSNPASLLGRADVFYDLAEEEPSRRVEHLRRAVADLTAASLLAKPGTGQFRLIQKNLESFRKQLQLCQGA